MPVLKNSKHEIFCRAIAAGKDAQEAYVQAGYKPNQGNSSTLRTKLEHRINEIKSAATKRCEVTVVSLLARLDDACSLAMEEKQASSAVQALMAQAKLAGLITDNQRVTVETVTNDMELARWISARLGDGKEPDSAAAPGPVEPAPEASRH
jgi:hypothetical protein